MNKADFKLLLESWCRKRLIYLKLEKVVHQYLNKSTVADSSCGMVSIRLKLQLVMCWSAAPYILISHNNLHISTLERCETIGSPHWEVHMDLPFTFIGQSHCNKLRSSSPYSHRCINRKGLGMSKIFIVIVLLKLWLFFFPSFLHMWFQPKWEAQIG